MEKKCNEIINRLNKTKTIKEISDLIAERDARQRDEKRKKKEMLDRRRADEEFAIAKQKAESEHRSYDRVMKEENMTSNKREKPVNISEYEESFF